MVLKRLFDENLAHASYLVGCGVTGDAVVIDPNRDFEQYASSAEDEDLTIVAVAETHIHADFLSGSRELSQRTGATLYLSDEGGEDWSYVFGSEANVRLIRDGDVIRIGTIRLDVLHSPGHTPEHISFVLTDERASPEPMALFSGDFVFVGDVGRPDLLERAASVRGTMEPAAKQLYRSLQRVRPMPAHLMVFPAHGAGSACGKSLGAVPVTTLGYERSSNWAMRTDSEEAFVRTVLEGQPDPPRYFAEMKRLNKIGPPFLGELGDPARLAPEMLDAALKDGVVIDTRMPEEALKGLVPGTLLVPLRRSFTTRCGWLVGYDKPIFVIAKDHVLAREAIKRLAMIGLDDCRGFFGPDSLESWRGRHGELLTVGEMSVEDFSDALKAGSVAGLDVRSSDEHLELNIPGVPNIPFGQLASRARELSKDKPIVVFCESGGRSPTAASILLREGFEHVFDLPVGFTGYEKGGFEIESGDAAGNRS